MPTITPKEIEALKKAGHVVKIYRLKYLVVVDGKRYKLVYA